MTKVAPAHELMLAQFIGKFELDPSMDESFDELIKGHGLPKQVLSMMKLPDDHTTLCFEWSEDDAFVMHGIVPLRKQPITFRPFHAMEIPDVLGDTVRVVFNLTSDGILVERGFSLGRKTQFEVRRFVVQDVLFVEISTSWGFKAKRYYRRCLEK